MRRAALPDPSTTEVFARWDHSMERHWRAHVREQEASRGRTLSLALIGVTVVRMVLARLIDLPEVLSAWWMTTAVLVVAVGSLGLLARAETLREVRAVNVGIQVVIVGVLCAIAPQVPYLGAIVVTLSLTIWGPFVAFAWPARFAGPMFGIVPVGFVLAHAVQPHDHDLAELAIATLYLLAAAGLCTAFSAVQNRTRRREFAATRQLESANADLQDALDQLVRAQDQLVESGKLAMLGQLMAGVAHELNTPLGAIAASADNLAVAATRTSDDLVARPVARSEEERAALRILLEASLSHLDDHRTTREERKARRAIGNALAEAGIEDAGERARQLVELGLEPPVAEHLPLLRSDRADDLLHRAYDLVSLHRNAQTIQTAAGRASRIVYALKSYAHPGASDAPPTAGSLAEHLDTALTLYRNQLKGGVEVVREYEDPGEVTAQHAALDQVWTNLVHNAIQAMDGRGRLVLRVSARPQTVRVEVEDDGPGIPQEVRARIFEPFFTTKGVGEGTGLGLSICRDIVARQGGWIDIDSAPGRTVFAVELPLVAPTVSIQPVADG